MIVIEEEKVRYMLESMFRTERAAKDIEWNDAIEEVMKQFLNLPTTKVEPVRHGRFVGTEYDGYANGYPVYYEWECSECGRVFEDDEPIYKYCPSCGAKMDGGRDDAKIH